MQMIRNSAAAVTADESRRGLKMIDLKRGSEWRPDEDIKETGPIAGRSRTEK